jgi:hypothetical protein
MTTARRQSLREIMQGAWAKFRFERGKVTFAVALRHAWTWAKGEAARAAATERWETAPTHRVLYLTAPGSSPIRRSLSGQAYAGRQAWTASRTTSRFGR